MKENLKRLSIYFTILFLIILAIYIYISNVSIKPKLTETSGTLGTTLKVEDVCNFTNETLKYFCEGYFSDCATRSKNSKEGVLYCLASNLISYSQEASNQICSQLNGDPKLWCLAIAFSSVNLTKAESFCDEVSIKSNSFHCHAVILASFDFQKAISWCERISEKDDVNMCKANLYANALDKTTAKTFCGKIEDANKKEECMKTFAS
jgi:hypothetical protein